MIRRLTVWIAALTVGLLMMAVVLAGAARVQEGMGTERSVSVDEGQAPPYGSLLTVGVWALGG